MTDDLVCWFRAVLDEDEANAREALGFVSVGGMRWLADIAAKRAILDAGSVEPEPDCEPSETGDRIQFPGWGQPTCSDNCGPDVWWAVVRLLASAYSHRDGYQEAWRP